MALFLRGFLSILLQSPDCPKWHVRLLYLSNMSGKRLTLHKLIVSAHGSLHDQLKVIVLPNRERKTRKRNECITGTALEPWITGKDIAVIILLTTMELMSSIDQTMEEVVARRTLVNLCVKKFLQATGLDFRSSCRKDDSLALLDTHFEISWNIEVFIRSITSLLLLWIFYSTIPVWAEFKLVLLRELHIKVWITSIHASLDSVVYSRIVTRSC